MEKVPDGTTVLTTTLDIEGTWLVVCFTFNPDGRFPATTLEVVERS